MSALTVSDSRPPVRARPGGYRLKRRRVRMTASGYLGLNDRTRTMTAFGRIADIRVRFVHSARQISNLDTAGGRGGA